jgi:hypothetical protein
MKTILKIISYIGLALTLFPAFFVFAGKISMEANYNLMLIGMLMWFFTAPLWVKKSNN